MLACFRRYTYGTKAFLLDAIMADYARKDVHVWYVRVDRKRPCLYKHACMCAMGLLI